MPHKKQIWIICLAVALALLGESTPLAAAEPELKSIFPAACRRGESVEVTLDGKRLDKGAELVFSQPGLQAEHIEKSRFRVTASSDTPQGDCDLWVATQEGLSGPRRFRVVDYAVAVEQESNDSPGEPQPISVGTIVEAKLDKAADLDRYSFQGEKDQLITIACRSSSLDGSVQPVFTLLGPEGGELIYSPDSREEPQRTCRLPVSGEFQILVHDRAYRKDDYSRYRLEIAAGPRLVSVFPHVVQREENREVTLYGYDLPEGKPASLDGDLLEQTNVTIDSEQDPDATPNPFVAASALMLDGFLLRPDGMTGAARIGVCAQPVFEEHEVDEPQTIKPPCRVAGRFVERGDVDWFRFAAKKGQTLHFESFGERLGQWMDLEAAVYDANDKALTTFSDLTPPKGVPSTLPLASLDAAGDWKAPADGEYLLAVRDLYGGSVYGVDRVYELLVTPPRDGVIVAAMCDGGKPERGLSVKRGGNVKLTLIAVRTGGFQGEVSVRVSDSVGGLTFKTCAFGEKEITKTMEISAAKDAGLGPRTFRLVAEAKLGSDKSTLMVRNVAQVRPGVTRRIDQAVISIIE